KQARLSDGISREGQTGQSPGVGLTSQSGRKVSSEDDCANSETIISKKKQAKLVYQYRRSRIFRAALRQREYRAAHDRRPQERLSRLQDAQDHAAIVQQGHRGGKAGSNHAGDRAG